MSAQVKMKIVDNVFNDISTQIGMLTSYGVFTFEEGIKILKSISDKEYEWMQNNFSDMEIQEFMRNKK